MSRTCLELTFRIVVGRRAPIMGLLMCISTFGPSIVLAVEAPACNDQSVLYQVRRAYEFALSVEGSSRKFQGEAVRELDYGGPNAWVNKHAPAKDYYHKSRYCEATMRLDNGQTEQAYYRIDALKEGASDNYNFDPCFIKHQDASKDECLYQRPSKK